MCLGSLSKQVFGWQREMSTASTRAPSDVTEKETQDADEQESMMDNQMKNELFDDNKERNLEDKTEGIEKSELHSLKEGTVDSQVYTATSLPVIPNETRTQTYPLVNASEHHFVFHFCY